MAKLSKTTIALEGDTVYTLTIQEVSNSFGVQRTLIEELVAEGVVEAKKTAEQQLQFNHEALSTIQTALRLHRDLGINTAGIGLALELMREIDRLHRMVGA